MSNDNNRRKGVEDIIEMIGKNDPVTAQKMREKYAEQQKVVSFKKGVLPTCMIPITFDELEKITPPPIEYVLDPILPTQGIGFIYAASGLGKSIFAMNLAYAIAGGGKFLKYTCPLPRKVLYVDAEMAFNLFHDRFMKIAKFHGKLDFKKNLGSLNPDRILPYQMPKLDDKDGQEIYQLIIDTFDYEVIFFDNLSMLSSIDENKSTEWKTVQDFLLRLRANGKTVIVIHHAGKDKYSYRGTSKMLDCVNTAISLQPVNNGDDESFKNGNNVFKISYEKKRDFGNKDAEPIEVIMSEDQLTWSFKSANQTLEEKIIEQIKLGMSQRAIAEELRTSQSKVCRLIKKMKPSG